MIIVDAHQDIAYNHVAFGRDYTQPAYKTRLKEGDRGTTAASGRATLGLPDALLGRVAVVFGTLFVAPKDSPYSAGTDWAPLYRDAHEAQALALKQMNYYDELAGENPRIQLIRTLADLEAVLATWAEGAPLSERVQGILVSMEGADPIVEPKQYEAWYERGVRAVGLAWTRTRYAGGTGSPGPLTPLGNELLEVLAETKTILDLSHLAEAAYLGAVERYEGPLIASHSNPRHFRDGDRHLSDEMIRLLAQRDGVIGVVMYNRFLHQTWQKGESRAVVPFTRILDVIDYVCQLTGSAAHIGLGSDFDGGFGVDAIPAGMNTVADLWWIGDGLRKRGYTEADIEAVLGGNFLRKVRESLPTG